MDKAKMRSNNDMCGTQVLINIGNNSLKNSLPLVD
ncbi:hypothetical protein T01_1092 [Trichinella spiralis]|uniref:Uncharacterized protein n=1 Tax=Trichinella spiralis TaxID=6334 RepID=A0A0V0Z0L3_TRISP|nr:hypothetical protein T01_1092 [Trichinella spiralis]